MQSEEKCDIIALYNRYIRTKKEEVVLMAEKLISVDRMETVLSLFGNYDENVNLIQKEYNVVILGRGDDIKITGDEENVFNASEAINSLIALINKGEAITEQTIRYVFTLVREGKQYEIKHMSDDGVCVTVSGKLVKPKTLGQKRYVEAIRKKTIVMGIGPAGTGKTYLAVAMAVKAFKAHEVEKIILTRPAVEAGEKLGFLPGDLQCKVDPYLRPLYDALFEMLGPDTFAKQQERGCIEVAPLAYMRGRTLDDSFIILDEAQIAFGVEVVADKARKRERENGEGDHVNAPLAHRVVHGHLHERHAVERGGRLGVLHVEHEHHHGRAGANEQRVDVDRKTLDQALLNRVRNACSSRGVRSGAHAGFVGVQSSAYSLH